VKGSVGAVAKPPLTIEQHIRALLPDLTPAERRTARAVLLAYPIAALETIAELAERADVSAPTILRWVAKLGYSGYPQFQRAVREEVQEKMHSPLSLLDAAPRLNPRRRGFLHGFLDGVGATLHELESFVDDGRLSAAVDLVADPRRRIWGLGGRMSHAQARYLVFHLHMLRGNVHEVTQSAVPLYYQTVDLGRRDVVVAFDYRRYEKQTIEYCRHAARRGARIVLITDPWLSPIADVAAQVLPVPIAVPSPFDSGVAAVALIEALLAATLIRLGRRARERMTLLERESGQREKRRREDAR
jgi:DNA-binding MurR/RpiR family transcriptional regulator